MREDLNQIQEIEHYLMGKMSASEIQTFEAKLKANPVLRASVDKQLLVMEASKRLGIKQSIRKGKRSYKTTRLLKVLGVSAIVIGVVITAFILLNKLNNESYTVYLPKQVYTIENLQDTVLITNNGMHVVIPANAFEDESENPVTSNIDFQIKEAFETYDIIKSGLTTLSNGELLETGGMFFLEAFSQGEKLKLRKGKEIFLDIPNINPKEGMMLFDGEYKEDGSINWINPKSFDKDLVTYDITTLDFYPEGYPEVLNKEVVYEEIFIGDTSMNIDDMGLEENEIENNKYYSKSYTDSLYYAYSRLFAPIEEPIVYLDGKVLFEQNCSACHALNKDGVGPDLKGSFEKWKKNGDDIYAFIKNPQSQYDAGVMSAIAIQYNVGGMNGQAVSNDEIDAIHQYIDYGTVNYIKSNFRAQADSLIVDDSGYKIYEAQSCIPKGINPALIKSIWNKKFNNTILATKEFEERLKVIHETHLDGVLNIYINNLAKPLWYSDSLAMSSCESHTKEFRFFYNQRKGGVKVDDALANTLSDYVARTQKEVEQQSAKAYNEFQEKKRTLWNEFSTKTSEKAKEEFNRKIKVFKEELDINLREAYRQLGKKKPTATGTINRGRLRVRTSTLGAKNVDQYVMESAQNRNSLNYVDSKTGKKANIAYNEAEIHIKNKESFDKLFVYMIPNKLNSFNRMNTTDNKIFKGKLNELLQYSTFCLGYIEEQAYYVESTLSKGVKDVRLIKISEEDLKIKLSKSEKEIGEDIKDDIDFYKEEIKFKEKRSSNQAQDELTLKVGKYLFPDLADYCIVGVTEEAVGDSIDYTDQVQ